MIKLAVNDNINLNMLELSDAPVLFKLVDENRLYLKQWLPWLDANTSVKDSRSFIASTHQQFRDNLGFMSGIFFQNELVGMSGFHPLDNANHSVVIGYWLAESAQGKGIVTTCVKFLINYAFKELQLNKVSIPAAEFNYKSQAVSKRLGLINEGIERDAEFLYGKYVNHVRYSVLRSEWAHG